MNEIEEVHEQKKADMKAMNAMKEKMTMMIEAKMSIRKMMEVNTAIVVAASTATEMDPIHLSDFTQVGHPISDAVGQGGEAVKNVCGPHYVQVQSKHSFPPYGLPPNYTSPNVVYAPGENVNNSTPILNENQQPQPNHALVSQPLGETHEAPQDHTLADFGSHPEYTIKGHAFPGAPVPNAPGGASVSITTPTLAFCDKRKPFHST